MFLVVSLAAAFRPMTRRDAGQVIMVSNLLENLRPPWAWGSPNIEATNQVVRTVNGIRHRRLGGTDIVVSEMGIGTQRWGGTDFNSPDEDLCHAMLDKAVANGVNLVDTAEQYPIPSGPLNPEGRTETIIGNWLKKRKRSDVVIASKITGGGNVNARNIVRDCEGSLARLGTDYLDVYLLHWPARYSPQSNWGQTLEYVWEYGAREVPKAASFDEIVQAMDNLVERGLIRGYGACNDNAVGLMGMAGAARALNARAPCCMQNDYSILNRRIEENGLSEAASPAIANCGFMAYNALAGGMLTGKYDDVPPVVDDTDRERAKLTASAPRGRMDTRGWGFTLRRYRTTAARQAAAEYKKLADAYNMTPVDLALRFTADRPAITSTLVGHTSLDQLDTSINAFRTAAKSPLPPPLTWEIDRIHMRNRLPLFANDKTTPDDNNEGFIGERVP